MTSTLAMAQINKEKGLTDNNPKKFNAEFDGIGPRVYIVPPPKTEEEVVTERYALKKQDQHQIDSLLLSLNLKKELKSFNTQNPPSAAMDSLKKTDEERFLLAGIHYYQEQEELNIQANWENNLAVFYILTSHFEQANELLWAASKTKDAIGSIEDQLLVLNNLALLEIKKGNSIQALALYDQLLERAKKTKSIDNQTLAYLAIARLEARLGNFAEAHNLIIKKSMPLLQRSKNYSRIVMALNDLASFKEMQNSDTEAKWIYLQAIDVARIRKDEKGLAISLFNLARLKNRIEDISLAILDYQAAKDLATKYKMEDLLVEIHDGLGDAYLKLHDYKAAAFTLSEYHLLKSDLLLQNHASIKISNNQ